MESAIVRTAITEVKMYRKDLFRNCILVILIYKFLNCCLIDFVTPGKSKTFQNTFDFQILALICQTTEKAELVIGLSRE